MIAVQVGPFCSVSGSVGGLELCLVFPVSQSPETLLSDHPNSQALGGGWGGVTQRSLRCPALAPRGPRKLHTEGTVRVR